MPRESKKPGVSLAGLMGQVANERKGTLRSRIESQYNPNAGLAYQAARALRKAENHGKQADQR